MDNGNGKASENKFAEVLRLVREKKQQQAAAQKPWSIDWIRRQELPRSGFTTNAHILSGRRSAEE